MMRVSNEMDALSRNSEPFFYIIVNNANLFPDVLLSLSFFFSSYEFFYLRERFIRQYSQPYGLLGKRRNVCSTIIENES